MTTRSKNIINTLIIFLLKGISHLPFRVLYLVSDFIYLIMNYIIGYRKKVIVTNIRNSFPQKNDQEVRQISNAFYHHLCDTMVETIKGYSMTIGEYEKRLTFVGMDLLDKYFAEGKSIIVMGMHYNNWEWSAAGQRIARHRLLMLYNPVRGNSQFEEFLLGIRERFGAKSIPVNKSARAALEFNKQNIPFALWLAADQRPPEITRIWTTFLNQETCLRTGPEKIARKTNQPMIFHLTRKIKRGHYEVTFIPMIDNPVDFSEVEILLTYVKFMEKYIAEKPEYYLWSHKRWKQKRPADFPIY